MKLHNDLPALETHANRTYTIHQLIFLIDEIDLFTNLKNHFP